MTTIQKTTGKLWSLNQWLVPLLTLCILPWGTWATIQIYANRERIVVIEANEALEDHVHLGEFGAFQREVASEISKLPPADWRKRIEVLEATRVTDSISLAKIQTSLEDIRERVIRLDEQHREKN